MADTVNTIQSVLPQHLIDAIDDGELTRKQLRELIEIESAELGLTFDGAYAKALAGTLPPSELGTDVASWLRMYRAGEA